MAERPEQGGHAALIVAPAPHVGIPGSTAGMTWSVVGALAPAAAWGIFMFGAAAVFVLVVSVGTAVLAELLCCLVSGRMTLSDGSAVLTGLVIGLLLSAGCPLYVPAAAAAFAILVVKQSFGGLGRNWMNPALAGVVFAQLSWGASMARWLPARGVAESGGLPPLDALRAAFSTTGWSGRTPLAVLASSGYTFSGLDATVVQWVNAHVLSIVGVSLRPGFFDLLVGHVTGAIGTICVPLLVLGAVALLRRGVMRWQVPVAFLSSFVVLAFLFGGLSTGQGWFAGGAGFQLFSGSLVLTAFFAATDPVTSPLGLRGRWVYGIGLGVLAFVMRFYGSLGDGIPVALVMGNCFVPLIDRATPRRQPENARKGVA